MKNTKPLKYQKKGAKIINGTFSGRCLLADQMGLGKTFSAMYFARKYIKKTDRPIIAVCPSYLKNNWQAEAKKHFGMDSIILNGRKPDLSILKNHPELIIINYEILMGWAPALRTLRPVCVFLDECQRVINPKTKTTLGVMKLCRNVPHIIAMSGTVINDAPVNIWPIANLLNPKVFNNYRKFVKKFCDPKLEHFRGRNIWNVKGSSNEKKLNKLLRKHIMVRRLKKDVLKDLPKKHFFTVQLEIKRRAEYERAEADFISWLESRSGKTKSKTANPMVKEGYMRRLIAELKQESVIQWIKTFQLENPGKKAVIFGIHRNFIEAIHKPFAECSEIIHGGISNKKRTEAEKRFKTDDNCKLLIANLQSAGVGLNFTCASIVAFAELPWLTTEIDQGVDRLHRLGQMENVFCYFLLASVRIETKILKLLDRKKNVFEAILNGTGNVPEIDVYEKLLKELKNG